MAAAFLRFHDLGGKSLWYDELYELMVAGKSISYILKTTHPLHSPLNQIITGCFLALGESEFVLRLPSAIWGICAVWVIYRAGRLFFGRREGLIGALLLTVSSYHLRYSQEARMYSFFVLTSLLSLYFFWKARGDDRRGSWIGYTVSTALALYTHLFAVFLIVPQAVLAFTERRGAGNRRPFWKSPFFISLLVIGLLFLPRVVTVFSHPDALKMYVRMDVGQAGGGERAPVPITPLGTIFSLYGAGGGPALAWYLFFLGAGLIAAFRSQRRVSIFLLLLLLTPAAVFTVFKPGHIFSPRYLIFLLPVYYLLIARGVTGLAGLLGRGRARVRDKQRAGGERSLVGLFCAGFVLLNINPLISYYANRDPEGNLIKTDWKALTAYLERNARPGDALIPAGEEAYYTRLALNYYLSNTLKKTVYAVAPESVKNAAIWWIGAGEFPAPAAARGEVQKIPESIDGLTVWRREEAISFAPVEIVNRDLGIDRAPADGVPDGWNAIDYAGKRENDFTLSIEETGAGPGTAVFRLEDRTADPAFVLRSAPITVKGGRRFWTATLIRGTEMYLEWFSPYLGVRFLDGNRQPVPAPEQGVRILLDRTDGWGLCVINGLTPPGARFLELELVENKGYRGKVSAFRQVRFYGDW